METDAAKSKSKKAFQISKKAKKNDLEISKPSVEEGDLPDARLTGLKCITL